MNGKKILTAAAVAAACGLGFTNAGADQDTAGGSGDANVQLNFLVEVPGVLRFRVGSSGSTVNTVTFDPTAQEMADGDTILGTDDDSSAGASAVTVELFTNRGDVTITENTNGSTGLTGTGSNPDTIDYSSILTSDSNGNIPAPTLSNSGANSVTVNAPAGSQFIDESDVWTYQLDTSNIQARPDDYTGFVTYTASTTP